MSATAFDAAMAWLQVAASAIERAAECAALGDLEKEERYIAARDRYAEMIRDANDDLKIAHAILERLEREREHLPDDDDPSAGALSGSFWEGASA